MCVLPRHLGVSSSGMQGDPKRLLRLFPSLYSTQAIWMQVARHTRPFAAVQDKMDTLSIHTIV
jgi:hypothetical protein